MFGPFLLWPNAWMRQDATWYGGRPRPRRVCVKWGPNPLSENGRSPQFSAQVYCGQTATQIKMPLGTEVGLACLRDIVLDGDTAGDKLRSRGRCVIDEVPALRERGTAAPSFRPMPTVATVAHLSYCWTPVSLLFLFLLFPYGRLSWLSVSFWAHENISLVCHVILYRNSRCDCTKTYVDILHPRNRYIDWKYNLYGNCVMWNP